MGVQSVANAISDSRSHSRLKSAGYNKVYVGGKKKKKLIKYISKFGSK